ncbi:MAG TPA: hypothetical protein VK576_06420, partial [Thermoleophilia bacterium]|nr:hypothetical protein [Thermoleophilia bacterium]
LRRQGRLDEATALLRDAAERAAGLGTRGALLFTSSEARAQLLLADAEGSSAAARRAALGEARRACRELQTVARADALAVASACRLRGVYESLRDRPKAAQACWRKSLAAAERQGARYEAALTRLEMGRCIDDHVALEQARADFAAIGAEQDLVMTRRLLEPGPVAERQLATSDERTTL